MNEEDFNPNALDTLLMEHKEDGLCTRALDLLGVAVLIRQDVGSLIVDMIGVEL